MAKVKQRYEAHSKVIDGNGQVVSVEIPYFVFFGESESAGETRALELVKAEAPARIGAAQLSEISIAARVNEKTFSVNASYSQYTDNETSEKPSVSFECSPVNMHVMNALAQTIKAGPNVGLLINCDENMKFVDGVDIITAEMRETYQKRMKVSSTNNRSFKRRIADLQGKVNSSTFKGWKAGEVLFLGVSYTGRKGETVLVNYNFAIHRNESDTPVGVDSNGDTIKVTKTGWQYVWTMPGEQATAPRKFIRGAYVATVYQSANFNSLGL